MCKTLSGDYGAAYNENDPYVAQWLRNLISRGLIAPGVVLECSIADLTPKEIRGFTQVHFFAGIGVWSYALRRAGIADNEPLWTASCPCQPFSAAGKGAGFADERHLWPALYHLISQCRPIRVFGEQVASKDGLAWLDLVQSDMEGADYTCAAVDTCAAGFGAPHIRQRLYWVADASSARLERRVGVQKRSDECATRSNGLVNGYWRDADWIYCRDHKLRPVEPGTFPLVDGAPSRVGRLRAYGNAIVATQAAEFIGAYFDELA